jgi:hypothetical protein
MVTISPLLITEHLWRQTGQQKPYSKNVKKNKVLFFVNNFAHNNDTKNIKNNIDTNSNNSNHK